MAKHTITIEDLPDGGVRVTSSPSIDDLVQTCITPEIMTSADGYAVVVHMALLAERRRAETDPARLLRASDAPADTQLPQKKTEHLGGANWGWEGEFNRGWNAAIDAMRITAPAAAHAGAMHDPSVVRAGLIGLAKHVRAVPTYAKLVGDMEVIDWAVALLAAATAPAALTGEQREALSWATKQAARDPDGKHFKHLMALQRELLATNPSNSADAGEGS